MLEVRLLGKFEIKSDGKPVAITSRPAQSLFAYLILSAGTAHRREKLAGMLWPDSLEETARDNLRHALWRIRKTLPPNPSTKLRADPKVEYLLADDLTIAFNASAEYWLDASAMEKAGESAPADELIVVLSAYQGELLPGFYDEWVVLEREHLSSIFENKMTRLMSLLQDEERWEDILDWGERWIKLGQKPEPAYRALMTAHVAKGDMSKVVATYERCMKSLKEFGIEPSEQTKELYENLKSGKETPKTISITTKPLVKQVSSSIPIPLTSFIGREKELKDIAKLLSASRLLTMIGPGGVGKTRLAIQTAHASIKKFKDGVCWVELVGLQDGSLIPQEIAQALDVREVSNQPMLETLKTHLKSKGLLLVLDNCEHLIENCAQTVEGLLAPCPKLKILATSRERLDLFNETTWNVPSLPLPEMQGSLSLKQLKGFASIELFVERAGNIKSDFVLTEQNASSVVQICDHLDGVPLAIELASARIKVLSVDEIASRLNDRFSLLTSGVRTALPRHQTLRATIDWSHDLLTEPERILFRRLAVFAGGFALEAAESGCSEGMKRSDILDSLGRLVDKSLVIVETDSETGATRYRLLETIRQYAWEKLQVSGELEASRNRHLAHFLGLAETATGHFLSPDIGVWWDKLEADHDNLRAALAWALESDQTEEAGLRMAKALGRFWYGRGYFVEGRQWLERVLDEAESNSSLLRMRALGELSLLTLRMGDHETAGIHAEKSLVMARELGDDPGAAWALANLGNIADLEGDRERAREHYDRSLALFRSSSEMDGIGYVLLWLGDMSLRADDATSAAAYWEQAFALFREMGTTERRGWALGGLGDVARLRGDFERATDLLLESLDLDKALKHNSEIPYTLETLGLVAAEQGHAQRATRLWGAAAALRDAMDVPLSPSYMAKYEPAMQAARTQLGETGFAGVWAEGHAMTLEEAIEFVLKEFSR